MGIRKLDAIPQLGDLSTPISLAIGVFDGLHIGHQEVVRHAIDWGNQHGGSTVVVTFDPHPVRVLRPERAPKLIASLRHKERLLENFGVSNLLVIPFDEDFAQISAGDFLHDLLSACGEKLGLISVGRNWRFGNLAAGDIDLLESFGKTHGVEINGVAPILHDGAPVSSTRLRAAITAGDFETARQLLGRDYTVLGEVERGQQLGRKLGFPTANLAIESEQLPPNGVYAVRSTLDGKSLPGVANLGFRPTVEKGRNRPRLEVHLIDFEDEIYGQDLEVSFQKLIRPEQKFESVDALREQIGLDLESARNILNL